MVGRARDRASAVAGAPVDLGGDVAAPGDHDRGIGRRKGDGHGALAAHVSGSVGDAGDRPVVDLDATRLLRAARVGEGDRQVDRDREAVARGRAGDVVDRVGVRLGCVERGQIVVGVLAALERVVLDHERVRVSGRRVQVREHGPERDRVTLAVVRVLGPEVPVLPGVVDALDRGRDLAITALVDVRGGICRPREHRRRHDDCKQKECCGEHATHPIGAGARDRGAN